MKLTVRNNRTSTRAINSFQFKNGFNTRIRQTGKIEAGSSVSVEISKDLNIAVMLRIEFEGDRVVYFEIYLAGIFFHIPKPQSLEFDVAHENLTDNLYKTPFRNLIINGALLYQGPNIVSDVEQITWEQFPPRGK